MRQLARFALVALMMAAMCWASVSEAAFFGLPRGLKLQLAQIGFSSPALPPMGHTRFCLRYPDECQTRGVDFRRRNIALTPERWDELNVVNRDVNREITPDTSVTDDWIIAPEIGDCKDYAVTKRHELLARGWPARALLLSEVVVPSGEHHLVLVVRTSHVDLVLDNLNANIRSVAATERQYQWIRIEMPQNPRFWATVSLPRTNVALAFQ
jgi:predicted transglutaminase-like cysteine proteinase